MLFFYKRCKLLTFGITILSNRVCYRKICGTRVCFRILTAPWRILFFGSDDFSEASLKLLQRELVAGVLVSRLEVVTTLKSHKNPVRMFALQNNISVHGWPISTLAEEFDVGIVVSFGHLIPERIIAAFPLGVLNVHASLLPRWRGAAPIVYAILHGDTTTGVSIMRIKPKNFDIGDIVKQQSCDIYPDETMLQLYSRLAHLGAEVLLECVRDLPHCLAKAVPQLHTNITYAPKLSRTVAEVRWHDMTSIQVYNLHRAISTVYPLKTTWHGLPIKLFCATLCTENAPGDCQYKPGFVRYHRAGGSLQVMCADKHWVNFKMVGIPHKKPFSAVEFYNGYLSKKKECDRIFI